jgi:2-polyprenyl-6-methoxyphenol hydroxylase-like FAD-dependent oxidoreductase
MNGHAIILGGSMAALGAAKALAHHFSKVTILERDRLSAGLSSSTRKGVPQGSYGHGLLTSGYRILDGYFPGMMDELVAKGASYGDITADFLWYQFGAWKLRADSGLHGIVASRPLLESAVRKRVAALPNVTIRSEQDVQSPRFDRERRRVTGVLVIDRTSGTTAELEADLVVDATGRGTRSPAWLRDAGFGEVEESAIRCNITYASTTYERRPGDFQGAVGGAVVGTPPVERRGGTLFAIEGDRWLVTLHGTSGERPPRDRHAFVEYARSLPVPDIHAIIADRQPLADIQSYRFDASRRRHYEKLERFPDGYLILGDAICSFNPAYGQGMSVALGQAKALDECLARGHDSLARRYFARAAAQIDVPWEIAAGEDMRYPEVEGRRPPGFAWTCSYLDRVHRAATRDPLVLKRLFEVASLLRKPTALMSPSIAFRVLFA